MELSLLVRESCYCYAVIIIVLSELYRSPRGLWLRKMMEQNKKAKRPRKSMVLSEIR